MELGKRSCQLVQTKGWMLRVQLKQLKRLPVLIAQFGMLLEKLDRAARIALSENDLIFHRLSAAYDHQQTCRQYDLPRNRPALLLQPA